MKKILLILIAAISIYSCSQEPSLKIAISKAKGSDHYENYANWLSKVEPNADYIDLYFIDRAEALKILKDCDGLLLSGGQIFILFISVNRKIVRDVASI